MAAPDSAGVPEVSDDEKSRLDTNPNPAPLEEVPFPDFEEQPSDTLFDLESTTPEPAPEPVKPKRSRAKPKTRCPFDAEEPCMPEEWRPKFEADFPTLDIDAEFRSFVRFHTSKGNVFADWKSALMNWLDKAVKFQARDAARSGGAVRPTPNFKRALQREDMVYTDDF